MSETAWIAHLWYAQTRHLICTFYWTLAVSVSADFSKRATQLTNAASRLKYASGAKMTRVDTHLHVSIQTLASVATYGLPPTEGSFETPISGMNGAHIGKALILQPIATVWVWLRVRRLCDSGVSDTTVRCGHGRHDAFADTAANSVIVPNASRGSTEVYRWTAFRWSTQRDCAWRSGSVQESMYDAESPRRRQEPVAMDTVDANCQLLHVFTREADVTGLLWFAAGERLNVKASAWFHVSKDQNPHSDAQRTLRRVIQKFDAERVMVGPVFVRRSARLVCKGIRTAGYHAIVGWGFNIGCYWFHGEVVQILRKCRYRRGSSLIFELHCHTVGCRKFFWLCFAPHSCFIYRLSSLPRLADSNNMFLCLSTY